MFQFPEQPSVCETCTFLSLRKNFPQLCAQTGLQSEQSSAGAPLPSHSASLPSLLTLCCKYGSVCCFLCPTPATSEFKKEKEKNAEVHLHLSLSNLVSIFWCSSSPRNPVYARHVDSCPLGFSPSSHRHSYIGFVFTSHFID